VSELTFAGAAAATDLTALERLRGAASKSAPGAVREAAAQFEALLLQSMLKSMRAANFGGGIFDSDTSNQYRDMLDQQFALELSKGDGIGFGKILAQQLGGEPAATVRRAGLSARTEVASAPSALAASARDFVQQLLPHAQAAARKLGVSAKALLAQAALETGWGQRLPSKADGSSSHNLFGIKAGASWSGDSAVVPTLEYDGDVARRVQARFRAYASPAASFEDYAALIGGDPRYAEALARGEDVRGFGQALQDAGYATDPDYGHKLAELAGSAQMRDALADVQQQ
jgi:peptidoglycan hydrolase FlgJ